MKKEWLPSDVGYVCGSIYAGGHVVINKKYGNYAIIFESRNSELVKGFIERLNGFSNKECKFYVKKRVYGNEVKESYIGMLYSKKDVKMLSMIGFVKDNELSIPELCYNNNEFMLSFLKGFFDSKATVRERHVYGKKRVSLRAFSAKRNVVENIKNLLNRIGIKCSVYRSGKLYCLDIEGRIKIMKFVQSVGFDNMEKEVRVRRALRYDESL